ncbi:MAG: hypothetical protein HC820_05365 [Hydrococcus sp. RM1_1_31]|nr:hypothetical protein [Hydrococcus sp. RM1_1_31]
MDTPEPLSLVEPINLAVLLWSPPERGVSISTDGAEVSRVMVSTSRD